MGEDETKAVHRFNLKIDKQVYDELAAFAKRNGDSVNFTMVELLKWALADIQENRRRDELLRQRY